MERTYATPDVVAQRAQVLALLTPQPGERVLDIGSGPGYLLSEIAAAVGPTGRAFGVDPSGVMNAMASRRVSGLEHVQIEEGDAGQLRYPDDWFDAAVSTQVYEYVADLPGALAQVHRVLRPGGRLLVLDTDWDSLVCNVTDRELHRRVIDAWEEHLVEPRLPRVLAGLLRRAGFTVTGQHVVPILNTRLHEDTYSHGVTQLIADFVPGKRGVTSADSAAWLADLRAVAAADEYFFSLNRYAITAIR